MRRVFISLVVVISSILLVGGTAPANAAPEASPSVATTERALPARPITFNYKAKGCGTQACKYKIWGKAKAWKHKPAFLVRYRSGNKSKFRKDITNAMGQAEFVVSLGRGTYKFRICAPKGNGYRASCSEKGVTIRIT